MIGCCETCTARKRRFLLQECPLCCPLGVDKGDGSVIQPRVRGFVGAEGGQRDARAGRTQNCIRDPLGRSGGRLVHNVVPTIVSQRVTEPFPVSLSIPPNLATSHDM